MASTAQEQAQGADYGLKREILSPMETLAQSVSTMAPTTTPAATIPLVCALAGNGTWLAYVLATVAILLVALCIGRFARYSASPGSLYTYASMILPPWLGATVAWSLLLAYVATGSSVIGGFYHYANLLLRDATGHGYSAVLLAILVTGVSIWIAYRDVKDFRAPHAVDRSRVRQRDSRCRCAAAGAPRLALGLGTTASARHDRQRLAARPGAGALQFCGVRECDHAGLGGAQSSEDDSPRRHPEFRSCRSLLHDLCAMRKCLAFIRSGRIWEPARLRCMCSPESAECLCSDC